tara:strand:- start:253170 stop:253628 length:459 start_codon:yes stop_codon:yes gene_type:complete
MTVVLALTLFPFAFGAMWCGVMWLLGRISGWHALSGHYAYRGEIRGVSRGFQSAMMGYSRWRLVRYRACLGVTVDSGMLILRPWFIFSLFHPPLGIPLDALVRAERTFLFWTFCELRAAPEPHVRILVSLKLARWIESSAGTQISSAQAREF